MGFNTDLSGDIRKYLNDVSAILSCTDEKPLSGIAGTLINAYQHGATVFTVGDDTFSMAASRMADDLVKRCSVYGRPGFKAICLSDSSALSNNRADNSSYEDIYKVKLSTLAKKGDVLCVFTNGETSESIARAAQYARRSGITVIGFLGENGGKILPLCNNYLLIPSGTAEQIEDIHIVYGHTLATVICKHLKDMWGLEVIFPPGPGRQFKFALFDFDGTLSLIREGWQQIMIPYFCEEVAATPGGANADPEEIKRTVTEFVDMLTGKQTIYQCIRLAEEVEKRGGKPKDPAEYKAEYLRRLMEKIKDRREGLANGTINPEQLLVRGSVPLLQALKEAGIVLYLASGTDQPQVREEAHLLDIDRFFDGNIYGALDEHATACTKELVIKRLIEENGLDGSELLSFGDGFVEIELVAKIGGYPIAVATDEKRRKGIDVWKRERLIRAGAGAVIPDFEQTGKLMDFILGKNV